MTLRERRKDVIKKELKKQIRIKFQNRENSIINPTIISRYIYSLYLDQLKYSSKEYAVDFAEAVLEEYPDFEKYLLKEETECMRIPL